MRFSSPFPPYSATKLISRRVLYPPNPVCQEFFLKTFFQEFTPSIKSKQKKRPAGKIPAGPKNQKPNNNI